MMKIAGDSNHLKQYRNPNELSKHEIFDLFPLRPQGIIQISQYLCLQKSLDDIVLSRKQELEAIQKAQNVEMKAENEEEKKDGGAK